MNNKTDFDKGWIIGFIEAEGSFTVSVIKHKRETKSGLKYYRYCNPAFFLVNKDRALLDKIRDFLKMGKINRHGDYFHLDIRRKSETLRLTKLLDGKIKSELRAQQFEKWKKRVLEWKERVRGEGVIIL
ncbi:MAG: hypothetical protein AVW06_02855 [Hadesarchaea archaeon DG-33-1]|nr:MAG: hypothetical protein AVW06_02855 [Hadesarchaea archaeon DG-33-1]